MPRPKPLTAALTALLLFGSSLMSRVHGEAPTDSAASLPLTVVEYNCENLFDTRHDTLKNDYEFLPDGNREWTRSRYWRKLNDVARVLLQCGGSGEAWRLPDLCGLTEVENDSCMYMLTRSSLLRDAAYSYVMTHSPDERGIDVALLYNPLTFMLLHSRSIPVTLPKSSKPLRDVLYASGIVRNGDTLHVFVLHAPSRSGDYNTGERGRRLVARTVLHHVDSILTISPTAGILVMGDFNDYSYNKSLRLLCDGTLHDVSREAHGKYARGTYRYQGEWGSLDHILLTPSLLGCVRRSYIHDAQWMLKADAKGQFTPRRTYLGTFYQGGVSDHLPLVLNLELPYR